MQVCQMRLSPVIHYQHESTSVAIIISVTSSVLEIQTNYQMYKSEIFFVTASG